MLPFSCMETHNTLFTDASKLFQTCTAAHGSGILIAVAGCATMQAFCDQRGVHNGVQSTVHSLAIAM